MTDASRPAGSTSPGAARATQVDRRVHAILQCAEDLAVIQTDLDLRITVWSRGAERILGWPAAEMLGERSDAIFTPEDVAAGAPLQEASTALEHGRAIDERWHMRRDGSRFWGSGAMSVERDEAGRPVAFVKLMKDLTAQRALEEQLRAADRVKDEFLATLAHELRNPLAPIRSALAVIGRAGALSDAQRSALGIAERQLRNLVRLVDDLLEVSRVTSGKLALQPQTLPLQSALETSLESIRPGAEEAGHHVDVRMPETPVLVHGDPVRLAQLFGNLLANSVKYTPPGGHIVVALDAADGTAEVRVCDDGSGIPPEVLPTVFDLFAQADRQLERQKGGLGIGLALVKRLVDMHGGTVAAESPGSGRGSTFRVRLPVVHSPATAPGPAAAGTTRPEGRRILIVDDDVDAADALAALLMTEGHEVRAVHDGASAVDAVGDYAPDVVFMDFGLPGMDGLETTRRIRALPLPRQPRIVALTGWDPQRNRDESRRAGVDDHLAEPADLAEIARLLRTVH